MREMKDSGISWVGEIPTNWTIGRIGGLYSLRNQKVSDKDYEPLSVTMKGVLPQLETAAKTNDGDNRKLVRKGDFAINSRSDRRGSCGIADRDGSVSLINTILKPRNQMNARYYNWLFHTPMFADEFYKWGHGIVDDLWSTNWEEMKKIQIPVPSCAEQQRIAEFLDRECGKIDGLKADIQAQIDTLEQYKRSVITEAVTHGLNPSAPMKDSGVDYIDKMKSDWRITKIGFVCSKLTRGFSAEDPALICSNNGSVMLRDEEKACGKMVSEDNAMQGIHIGDIAIHGMDTWHGAIGFSKIKGKITRVVHVCDSTEDKRFIVYYLKSLAYQNVYKLISNGVRGNTSDFRSWDKVKDIYICLPATKKEENEICDYLDAQCENIDMIIADKKTQIETLDGYKKSLIYEYVTGKKEVV